MRDLKCYLKCLLKKRKKKQVYLTVINISFLPSLAYKHYSQNKFIKFKRINKELDRDNIWKLYVSSDLQFTEMSSLYLEERARRRILLGRVTGCDEEKSTETTMSRGVYLPYPRSSSMCSRSSLREGNLFAK